MGRRVLSISEPVFRFLEFLDRYWDSDLQICMRGVCKDWSDI